MSTPTGDNAFLHELELDVRAKLTLAETSQPEAEAAGIPGDDLMLDPDAQRYEVSLHTLLDAAFRYGHGQIRHTYRLVDGGPAVPLFPNLIGFGPLPAGRRLDLAQVFDMPGHPPAQRAKRLDGQLAASLIALPEQVTGAVDTPAYHSLAVRDLLRGETTGLPSGEAVALLVGATPLTPGELEHTWPHGTPLWFYILKEAEHRGGGDRLGPVGGQIVTEVLIGLLRADPASYLCLEPDWQPTLPAAGPGYGLADLITLGVHRDRPARPA